MSKNKPLFFIAQQIKMVGREYVWKKINKIFLSNTKLYLQLVNNEFHGIYVEVVKI